MRRWLVLLGLLTCQGTTLYHGWTPPANLTALGCSTSSYTSIESTAAGGYFPFITGDSLACKAWKLAATICTTAPTDYYDGAGTITPSGPYSFNFWCPNSGGFTDVNGFGTYCAVANQYLCTGAFSPLRVGVRRLVLTRSCY